MVTIKQCVWSLCMLVKAFRTKIIVIQSHIIFQVSLTLRIKQAVIAPVDL